jgi:hypothetical protein
MVNSVEAERPDTANITGVSIYAWRQIIKMEKKSLIGNKSRCNESSRAKTNLQVNENDEHSVIIHGRESGWYHAHYVYRQCIEVHL